MNRFFTPGKISENIRETPEGYLLCLDVRIARTGDQEYAQGETPLDADGDGKVIVYRDAKEVFRPITIASGEGKPITIRHPEKFVSPENWKDLSKGIIQNLRKAKDTDEEGEQGLLADLLITDSYAIGLVRNGLREVSCGYEAEYEQDEPGRGRQTNILINHLALVEEGRAGPSYAINDHKGKDDESMFDDLKKAIASLTKTVDEAQKKSKKEPVKTNDDQPTPKASEREQTPIEMKTFDEEAYDELVQAVKDLGEKVSAMGKGKDEDEEMEDEDPQESDTSKRLAMLEKAVAKLLRGGSSAEDEEEESAAMEDEEEDPGEEAEDEEMEDEEEEEKAAKKTGDTASRIEILAPGLNPRAKNAERKALERCYATKDGKAVIKSITGGKEPNFNSRSLFRAASEILKHQRGVGLDGTKDVGEGVKSFASFDHDLGKGPISPEKLNEIHAAHWAGKVAK